MRIGFPSVANLFPFRTYAGTQDITCPLLLAYSNDEDCVHESHFNDLADILRQGRESTTGRDTRTVSGFMMDRIPSTEKRGELIIWRGSAGSHSEFVATEVVVDMVGEIMHLS